MEDVPIPRVYVTYSSEGQACHCHVWMLCGCGNEHIAPGSSLHSRCGGVRRHLYVECTGAAGLFEFSIDEERVVNVFPDIFGVTVTTPDEGFILVVNRRNNTVHVLRPGVTGTGSTEDFVIDVPGAVW